MRSCSLHVLSVCLPITAMFLLGSGCQSSEAQTQTSSTGLTGAKAAGGAISAEASKQAEEIFSMRCTPCHGPEGRGNGPAAAALNPKPRNFHDTTWQGSVTDEHIEKIIQYGGASVGKSPAMPPNPDLVSKPEVVAALRAHVRSLSGN